MIYKIPFSLPSSPFRISLQSHEHPLRVLGLTAPINLPFAKIISHDRSHTPLKTHITANILKLRRSHQFGFASRFPRNNTAEFPRESGVATQGDLDSLEGPRVPWTRGVAASRTNRRTDGRTDGQSARRRRSVGVGATIGRGRKERSSSAPSNSVDDVRLRRCRSSLSSSGIRFAGSRGAGALLGAAGCAATPGVLPPLRLPPLPPHSVSLFLSISPAFLPRSTNVGTLQPLRAGPETSWMSTHRVASRRAASGRTLAMESAVITPTRNFVNDIDTFANENLIFVSAWSTDRFKNSSCTKCGHTICSFKSNKIFV